MIEYALLFALGFLAATLTGLLVAPAIQKRIVKFTEARMRATMPLSPQEVRAQKDLARAAFAAENARLAQDVRREREKHTLERVKNEKLFAQASEAATENADLHAEIADMQVEAGELRSAIRRADMKSEQLTAALATADRELRTKTFDYDRLTTQMGDLKIDLATHETTVENLKSRVASLKDERDRLREDVKTSLQTAKSLETRLSREEARVKQLEAKLTREQAGAADKDSAIERRIAEVNKLRDKVKTLTTENKEAHKAARGIGEIARIAPRRPEKQDTAEKDVLPAPIDIGALEEEVRSRGAALSERLLAAQSSDDDPALREEMADIASKMIVLTAAREGAASPVHDLIATINPALEGGETSLAKRVRKQLKGRGGA